jgi:hypothetical protein
MPSSTSCIAIGLALSAALLAGSAGAEPRPFSLYGLAGWDKKTFFGRDRTVYAPVSEGRVQVIEAQCDNSASGYVWRDKIDLKATPILTWRWKVENLYPGLDERAKAGDDFPARVYAVHSGALGFGTRALMYVWSGAESAGEGQVAHWPGPYTDSTHMVAVRSGAAGVGEWQQQWRDVRADFKEFFGLELEELDGVAIMTDCDDHKGKGRAWYGDLRVLPPLPPPKGQPPAEPEPAVPQAQPAVPEPASPEPASAEPATP